MSHEQCMLRIYVSFHSINPSSFLAKSHYAAASRVPLIQSPSLRVPRPVELPPDIHPLPESVNPYVSSQFDFSHVLLRPPFPPPKVSLSDLLLLYVPSSSTPSLSSPTSSQKSPSAELRSQPTRHAAKHTSMRARTRSSAGNARRFAESRLDSSRPVPRSYP